QPVIRPIPAQPPKACGGASHEQPRCASQFRHCRWRIEKGDYVISQLERRMNTDALVGDIVGHWLKYGERRRTICFAVGVGHSAHIKNEFEQFGVRAEHLDGETSIADRAAILARLASGETEVVTNCAVLTEGWDMPAVSC